MLNVFTYEHNRFVPTELATRQQHGDDDMVWIDLSSPTPAEIETVAEYSQLDVPELQETVEIEASSHYEVYADGLQVNCSFLHQVDGVYTITNVAFLADGNCLISVCAREVPILTRLQTRKTANGDLIDGPLATVIALIEDSIERLADLSEAGHLTAEKIGRQIFNREDTIQEDIIDKLSREDDLNGKIRLCLMDAQRDLNFLLRRGRLTEAGAHTVNDILEDIKTLLSHNNFLSERLDFLLNAALGFINIEQNKIIKIFSIVAVVFMPPTVIASIYGMNFRHLPELSWYWGYPMSLLLMTCAGIAPYLYFKNKGWL
ncbi:MAG: magnesium/cobalt transporter CorA [Desulfopila sp.]